MRRLRTDERGFTMLTTVVLLTACMAFAAAAFTAVNGDQAPARADAGRKTALEAAQAGAAWYSSQLRMNPDYWLACGNVPSPDGTGTPAPVTGTPLRPGQADTRTWRPVTPGASEQFTVELLPANASRCDPTSSKTAAASMLSGNRLRVRVTGRATPTSTSKRSLVVTYRKPSFLNYVYYTDYETLDPDADTNASTTLATCGKYARDGRGSPCTEIQFGGNDAVRGPLHTNDELYTCGKPTFGRTRSDRIEVSDPDGYRRSTASNCSGSPTFNGLKIFGSEQVTLPPNNQALASLTQGNLMLSGSTQIALNATNLQYRQVTYDATTGVAGWTSWVTTPYPANGLIYVANSGGPCPATSIYSQYDLKANYGCGTAYVSGTYGQNLTIGAASDVVAVGDITGANDSILGLIGNNYVRVAHPIQYDAGDTACTTDTGSTGSDPEATASPFASSGVTGTAVRAPWHNPVIEAGILAVNHSFIVDNYSCGSASRASLGSLKVSGAIAQKFRGPVAQSSGSTVTTGYVKNYLYDDRFGYREPPNFLDPLKAAWIFTRQVEQLPAT